MATREEFERAEIGHIWAYHPNDNYVWVKTGSNTVVGICSDIGQLRRTLKEITDPPDLLKFFADYVPNELHENRLRKQGLCQTCKCGLR